MTHELSFAKPYLLARAMCKRSRTLTCKVGRTDQAERHEAWTRRSVTPTFITSLHRNYLLFCTTTIICLRKVCRRA